LADNAALDFMGKKLTYRELSALVAPRPLAFESSA